MTAAILMSTCFLCYVASCFCRVWIFCERISPVMQHVVSAVVFTARQQWPKPIPPNLAQPSRPYITGGADEGGDVIPLIILS